MKTIVIAGASGFVGSALIEQFKDDNIITIKRNELSSKDKLIKILEKSDVLINLAGANIINRWSESYKKVLYSSRIDTTKALVNAIGECTHKPKLFISTSAVGIYKNDKSYDEKSEDLADDFLANLCKDWETQAFKAKELDVRTAIFRFGIVLGRDGGALKKMLTPFRLGLGGTIGSGSQAFSFIHISDLLEAYRHIIDHSSLEGVFNLSAPMPTTNFGLTKALGKSLHRPTILPLPEFVLRAIFSEGAKVLTDGQSALPARLVESGFKFQFETIEECIDALV